MGGRISYEELIEDLQRVRQEIGSVPSESEYADAGEYSPSAVRRAFGTFTNGREAAGMGDVDMRGGHNKVPREAALKALNDLAAELGRVPTRKDMRDRGEYHSNVYRREFATWNKAVAAADLQPHQAGERFTVTCQHCGEERDRLVSQCKDQEYHFCSQNCLHAWRSETFNGEMHPLHERVEFSCELCGQTDKRIRALVENRENVFCSDSCYHQWLSEERSGEKHPRWKGGSGTYYGPNWRRKRAERLEKDGYQCQQCGMSQEQHQKQYGRGLSVHHKKSLREFYAEVGDGELPDFGVVNDVENNLITLCLPCHRRQ